MAKIILEGKTDGKKERAAVLLSKSQTKTNGTIYPGRGRDRAQNKVNGKVSVVHWSLLNRASFLVL